MNIITNSTKLLCKDKTKKFSQLDYCYRVNEMNCQPQDLWQPMIPMTTLRQRQRRVEWLSYISQSCQLLRFFPTVFLSKIICTWKVFNFSSKIIHSLNHLYSKSSSHYTSKFGSFINISPHYMSKFRSSRMNYQILRKYSGQKRAWFMKRWHNRV